MAELKRYSSSSTETASVSDSPGSNTPANKSPKSTKLEVPTENHHAHYYFFNQHDTERNSNKEVVKENITESDKNSHNLNDINKTHQPSTNTSLVRSVENNKVNSSEVKQKINDINLSHNYHELTTSLSDVNMNTEKMFSHNINSKSDNFPIGSIIEIHSEYDSKLNDQPKPEGKQSSIITIFTIWNTIMGTSILVMPWAIQQAGFTLGIFLILFVAFIAWYCGYLVLKATEDLKIIQNIRSSVDLEFTDVCLYHLGKPGYILALSFSMLSLIGAIIVYYVLMCNFLYYTGDYIYHKVHSSNSSHLDQSFTLWNKTYTGATCSNLPLVPIEDSENIIIPNLIQEYGVVNDSSNTSSISTYNRLWSKTRTVPGWLLIVIIPLISIKSPTFLGKFSALGTICVLYLVTLVCLKAGQWGINMDFSSNHPYRVIPQAQSTFVSLTGICSLAFFCHNTLHTLTRTQKRPENNTRDVAIAFLLVTITYLSIGLIFYCSFPLAKSCIEDNLLNNLVTDIPVFIGRFFSLLQMFTVFPIILYVLRVQIMTVIFKKPYPGFLHVTVLHLIILGLSLTFSILMPKIGTIIRFSGSLCGLVYMFTLPPLMYLLNKHAYHRLQLDSDGGRGDNQKKTEIHSEKLLNNKHVLGNKVNNKANDDHIPFNEFQLDNRSDTLSIVRIKLISEHETLKWWFIVGIHVLIMLLGLLNFIGQFSVFFTSSTNTK
ncbi:Sodium-coupled neutral amino acid transporter 9 [Schistosoma japonicum]|nr:Sodium-coupled neutral amino acid transporter 9 [Schistosoma japonicum]KAH8873244.1 Sodium-coupled neutral amino acid transporter 9 [Schistosoma japonicum]